MKALGMSGNGPPTMSARFVGDAYTDNKTGRKWTAEGPTIGGGAVDWGRGGTGRLKRPPKNGRKS